MAVFIRLITRSAKRGPGCAFHSSAVVGMPAMSAHLSDSATHIPFKRFATGTFGDAKRDMQESLRKKYNQVVGRDSDLTYVHSTPATSSSSSIWSNVNYSLCTCILAAEDDGRPVAGFSDTVLTFADALEPSPIAYIVLKVCQM